MELTNPEDFKDAILDFVKLCKEELESDSTGDAVDELQTNLRSGEASKFTDRMNDRLKGQGEEVGVDNPADSLDEVVWDEDKRAGKFTLSSEEDRWFRSDKLFGPDVAGKSGFKYTDR